MTSEAEPVAMGPGETERRDTGMTGSGDERVDAALGRLGDLAGAPVADHVQIFADVHRGLQEVLGALDQEAADGARDQQGGGPEAEAGS